jgi:hypothetical protein
MLGIFEKQVKQACKNGNMKEVQKKDIFRCRTNPNTSDELANY